MVDWGIKHQVTYLLSLSFKLNLGLACGGHCAERAQTLLRHTVHSEGEGRGGKGREGEGRGGKGRWSTRHNIHNANVSCDSTERLSAATDDKHNAVFQV